MRDLVLPIILNRFATLRPAAKAACSHARFSETQIERLTTMRFMMLVIPKVYEAAGADFVPSAELVAKMTKYNESLTKAGVLLGLDGLQPPAKAARVRFSGAKPKVTDGPFAEAKEVVGGYWMIQVKSRDEAIEWAKRAPMQDGDIIEVRQVQEISDFPPDVQKAAGR
ncbi:MAG TPA: YciI family protein [Gemmatimonadales bacterium]